MFAVVRVSIPRRVILNSCRGRNTTCRMSSNGGGKVEGTSPLPPFNPAPSFRITTPPNPAWKYGERHEGSDVAEEWKKDEEKGWKSIDTSSATPKDIYPLMISGIIPRPIAFVSSLSENGIPNLAPFRHLFLDGQASFLDYKTHREWIQVSHNPPLVSVSFFHPRHKEKDTSENIRATKGFTVNIISEPFVTNANFTSIDAPEDVDEWIGSGLTQEPSSIVKPPRVKESAFSMECELFHLHDISPPGSLEVTGTLILGHVKMFHVRNAVLNERGTIEASKLRAVSRLGGLTYGRIGDSFDLPRLLWKECKDAVEALSRKL